jgi:hypothetical protein
MSKIIGQTGLGFRWLTCGRRVFLRNPWLLGGMGLWIVLSIAALAWIPFVGSMVIAFLTPLFLGSVYLAIDAVTQQKMSRPVLLYKRAIKQSLPELGAVFRDERHVVPAVVAALYCVIGVLIANVLIQMVAGGHWAKEWGSLGAVPLAWVVAAVVLAFLVYFLLAWPLVYGLPLTFLRRQPLFPAMRRSLKASLRNALALSVIFLFLMLPIVVGALVSLVSVELGYVVGLLLGVAVLPMTMASLYCSYRTVFPQDDAAVNRSPRARPHRA